MKIRARKEGKIDVLEFTGELSITGGTGDLRDLFRTRLDEGGRLFVFDLLGVAWLDSSGIGEIVACYKRARENGADVKLVLKGKAHDLFTYCALDRVFEIYETLPSAVASFIK
jgi:anti-sigma B factor antagonist